MAFEPGLEVEPAAKSRPIRVPLAGTGKRLSMERRLCWWMVGFSLPPLLLLAALLRGEGLGWTAVALLAGGAAVLWSLAAMTFFDQLVRPLQTLSNIVVALRENDFSFRARGARRGDALGDLAYEINALAGNLQQQRNAARDAVTLAERVMMSMQSPVLAFDGAGRLRLLNAAAERNFGLERTSSLGCTAEELNLLDLMGTPDSGMFAQRTMDGAGRSQSPGARWSLRRAEFRLHGVPHTLMVLSDVAAALREEERLAWQRIIRVLGHEINNSLTPIQSIASSLRSRVPQPMETESGSGILQDDLRRGLAIIEDRSASLHRFLQAYQRLSRLPAPVLESVSLKELLERVANLEQRLVVALEGGPELTLRVDRDQMQQLLINIIQNAADASISGAADVPRVQVSWFIHDGHAVVRVRDNGQGISNPANLFVPFYTTKPTGMGIGLVLAQQIATAHGGALMLMQRRDAQGCDAEISLPLR